ncbi:MAG: flagellar basal body-associated FliL family protein [Nitrospirota bacterium]|nr:flagellar basal body-associated FliL family protein [Nitrospirota bacterium]
MKSRNFLYAIIGIVSLLVGVFLGAFLLKGEPESSESTPAFAREPIAERALDLGPSVVNLLGDGAAPLGHYARVQVQVVFVEKKAHDYGKSMVPILKDIVLDRVSRLSYTEALSPKIKATLKKELRERINHSLGGQLVDEILITEYIVE